MKRSQRPIGPGLNETPLSLREHARGDTDLAPLRDRPKFRKLLRDASP